MKRIYAEIGFGNHSFLSTEIEEDDREHRLKKFIKPDQIDDYYLRIWFLKRVFILSTKDGLKIKKKDKVRIKIIVGLGGLSSI